MNAPTEVCSRARGMMVLAEGTPSPSEYRPAFACSVLLYPPPHRPSLRRLSLTGALRAYQVPLVSPKREGSRFPPVMLGVPVTGHLTP